MMLTIPRAIESGRLLDFDIENRPLSYGGPDFSFCEITAIAASFGPNEMMYCWLLGVDYPVNMLKAFRSLYDEADIVTGHYILKHDLPIINGALLEYGMEPLGPKLVCDTKQDLVPSKGISVSQESMGVMFSLEQKKYHMTQPDWRSANRLTPEGLMETRKRVTSDVRMHQKLREELLQIHFLRPPRLWNPGGRR